MPDAADGRPKVVTYDEHEENPSWKKAVDHWKWHAVPGTYRWKAEGNCPRCGHPTELEVEEVVILAPAAAPGGSRVQHMKPSTVEFRCFCSEPHAAGKTGCGLLISAVKGP